MVDEFKPDKLMTKEEYEKFVIQGFHIVYKNYNEDGCFAIWYLGDDFWSEANKRTGLVGNLLEKFNL